MFLQGLKLFMATVQHFVFFFLVIIRFYLHCSCSEVTNNEGSVNCSIDDIDSEIVKFFDTVNRETNENEIISGKRKRSGETGENYASEVEEEEEICISNSNNRTGDILKELEARFESQRSNRESFNLKNYHILNWPEGISILKRYWSEVDSNAIMNAIDTFVFVPRDEHLQNMIEFRFPENDELIEIRKQTISALIATFKSQRPHESSLNLFKFQILNWPKRIAKMKESWNEKDCRKIQLVMDTLVFLPILKNYMGGKKPDGLIALESIPNLHLNASWTRKHAHNILLERYSREIGQSDAVKINWNYIDRSAIDPKYDKVPLNGHTLRWIKVHRNEELIDSIHFRNPTI